MTDFDLSAGGAQQPPQQQVPQQQEPFQTQYEQQQGEPMNVTQHPGYTGPMPQQQVYQPPQQPPPPPTDLGAGVGQDAILLDFSGVGDWNTSDFTPIPDGIYWLRCTEFEFPGPNKNNDTQLLLHFVVAESEPRQDADGSLVQVEGKALRDYWGLPAISPQDNEKTRTRKKNTLKKVRNGLMAFYDIDIPAEGPGSNFPLKPRELPGRLVRAIVTREPYTKETDEGPKTYVNNSISGYLRPQEERVAPTVKHLDSLLKQGPQAPNGQVAQQQYGQPYASPEQAPPGAFRL